MLGAPPSVLYTNMTTVTYTESAADQSKGFEVIPLLSFLALTIGISILAKIVRSRIGLRTCGWVDVPHFLRLLTLSMAWFAVSVPLTLYNKWFNHTLYGGLAYPLALTTIHMVTKGLIAVLILKIYYKENLSSIELKNFIDGAPVGLSTGLDIAFTIWSYVYIDVSMATVIKSTSMIFTYIISVWCKLQILRFDVILSMVSIFIGILLYMIGDLKQESVQVGFILSLSATIMSATRWSLTEVLLKKITSKSNAISNYKTLLFISPSASLGPLIMSLVLERKKLVNEPFMTSPEESLMILFIASLGGIAAVALLFFELQLVHVANAVTLAVIGHCKEITLIIMAIVIFSEEMTIMKFIGVGIAISGTFAYSYLKSVSKHDLLRAALFPFQHLEEGQAGSQSASVTNQSFTSSEMIEVSDSRHDGDAIE